MRIRVDKSIVEFIPENKIETTELETMWIKIANCIGATKRLEPIGVYIPSENNIARFHIEGLSEEEAKAIPEMYAPYETDVYCSTCNTTIHLKAGERVPICCGRLMEILD